MSQVVARIFPFVQLDVFTREPFAGNPLAVFPSAEGLSDAEMQRLAREMNLSETTFVLPPTKPGADYRVRIFTPASELPYAGHPSIGTAWHLATSGRIALNPPSTRVHQEVLAGVLPIDLECDAEGRLAVAYTTQAPPTFQPPVNDRARVARALGLAESDLHARLPPQVVSTGLAWLLVPLKDAEALDRVRPDAAMFAGKDAVHPEVYPFVLGGPGGAATEARGFPMREFEDPATGSASGCLGAYLVRHGMLQPRAGLARFTHAQGRHLHRPSRIEVEVRVGRGGEPDLVRVGGPAVQVLRGEVTVP